MKTLADFQRNVLLLPLLSMFFFSSLLTLAQDGTVTTLDLRVNYGEPFPPLVEAPGSGDFFIEGFWQTECFFFNPETQALEWSPNAQAEWCCGNTFTSETFFVFGGGAQTPSTFVIEVEIKCPKPDCSSIDLSEYIVTPDPAGGDVNLPRCISVCEDSEVLLFYPFSPQFSYAWTISEPYTIGVNDAQAIVQFGSAGSTVVVLTITTPGGEVTTHTFCVDVLEGPEAAFTTTGVSCLNAPMTFENLFPFAASYTWDFGDGNIVNDDAQFVQHTYAAPGTYTVTLTATLPVFDEAGNPLCCCTKMMTTDVVVDELEGPTIECISILCEGDTAVYTTNATGCTDYIWTVTDADGNTVNISNGEGTPSIEVVWGDGPFGTVTLQVTGCDDEYCPTPTTVIIPIISAQSEVAGPSVVCQFSTHTYTVPKWPGTSYVWTVTGGTVVGNPTGNTAEIDWGAGPVGTINVTYVSNFLFDLTGHDGADCQGEANLTVDIRPSFVITNTNPEVCQGQSTTIWASNSPSGNYIWTVEPSPNGVVINPQNGFADFTWSTSPGTYIVTATPVNPNDYCNAAQSTVVTVLDNPPPTSITGPTQVCAGETVFYTATPSVPGATFQWSVVGGSLSSTTGTTVSVNWGTNPQSISVSQVVGSAPPCVSNSIGLTVSLKSINGPLAITGTGLCNNSVQSYTLTPGQHPDATVQWQVIPQEAGTVIAGQGTTGIDVQWNDYVGPASVLASVQLCNQTQSVSTSINLVAAQKPVIVQNGAICPGGNGILSTTQPFQSYQWNTGATTPTISVTSGGWYNVTTEDANGCFATSYYEAVASPAPIASISTGDPQTICIPSTATVTIVAQTSVNYVFEWFMNGSPVQGPSPVSSYTHNTFNVPGSYVYTVTVTDTSTGCTANSNSIVVVEDDVCLPGICNPEPYTLNPFATPSVPDCNQIAFDPNGSPNFTHSLWSFGDGALSTSANAVHSYPEAGCYLVQVTGSVPSLDSGFCSVGEQFEVCVPLVARFEFVANGCGSFDFTNTSTWLDPPAGTPIQSVLWDFGSTTATTYDASYTFPDPGVYPVTLTITNASGCQTSTTVNVTVGGVGVPSITTSTPVCAGEPTSFSGNAAGAVQYTWDFGDPANSSFVGQNASFAYLTAGTYTVTLTVEDQAGCTKQTTATVVVNPGVPDTPIFGALVYCEGDETTLSVPPVTGHTYLWSNGETTNQIQATAGTYSVTITNSFGCQRTIGPVTVTEVPAPIAFIDGDSFICDSGCETLTAPLDPGYTYKWFDGNGNQLPQFTGNTAEACDWNVLPATFVVEITDQNGCTGVSNPFTVDIAVSPAITLTNTGSGCAGEVNQLEVQPNDPNIGYSWSTGATGNTISVSAAGTYSVTGTDLTTGCQSTLSTVINPLPDLCSVPYGCYEQCDSITVCVASGLGAYQWNLGGVPIPGANSNCLFVDQSGEYTLTVTTPEGCEDTSAVLQITIIPCGDCEDIELTYTLAVDDDGNESPCCATVSYDIGLNALYELRITSPDAGVGLDVGTLDTSLGVQSNTLSEVRLGNANQNPQQPLPQGALVDFATICAVDPVNQPQTFYFEWLDVNGEVVCLDSLTLNCPVEPPCLYVLEDSVYCEAGLTFYEFTICNPLSQSWAVGFVELIPSSPTGVSITPPSIDLSGNPLAPGDCLTVTVELTGAAIGGSTFCYTLVGHEENPADNPSAICCSIEEEVCVDLPQCDPCDDVWVEGVTVTNEDECCYTITLFNGFDGAYFDEIRIVSNSNLVSFTINNPVGSGWQVQGYTGAEAGFIPGNAFGGFAPLGSFTLPEICVVTNGPFVQSFTVQWMQNGVVVCDELMFTDCEPPCGYIFDDSIDCDPTTSQYIFTGFIKNTADYTVGEAVISFSSSSGLDLWNTTIPLGTLMPDDVFGPFSFPIGAPAQDGDSLCFTVTLHELNADGIYLNCCNFTYCDVLPDCGFNEPCVCDDEFVNAVAQGFTFLQQGFSFEFSLAATGAFNDECDIVRWGVTGVGSSGILLPSDPFAITLPGPGNYTVLFKVSRVDENGDTCAEIFIGSVTIGSGLLPEPNIFPNPNNGQFKILVDNPDMANVEITIFDAVARPVIRETIAPRMALTEVNVNLGVDAAQGMYFVHIRMGEELFIRKITVSN
jgi:PKD repeat protein